MRCKVKVRAPDGTLVTRVFASRKAYKQFMRAEARRAERLATGKTLVKIPKGEEYVYTAAKAEPKREQTVFLRRKSRPENTSVEVSYTASGAKKVAYGRDSFKHAHPTLGVTATHVECTRQQRRQEIAKRNRLREEYGDA